MKAANILLFGVLCIILAHPLAAASGETNAPAREAFAGPPIPAPNVDTEVLGGLTLLEAYQITLANNPEILVAKTKIPEAAGRIMEIQSNLLPRLVAGGVYLPPTFQAGVTQPLLTRATIPIIRLSRLLRTGAEINLEFATLESITKVRTAYAAALFAQKRIRLLEERLKLLQDRSSRAPTLFDAGRITRADLNILDRRVSVAKLDVEANRADYEKALVELSLVLGIDSKHPRFMKPLSGDLASLGEIDKELPPLIDEALARRPDLLGLEKLKLGYQENIRIVSNEYYPIIAAYGSTTLRDEPPGPLKGLDTSVPSSNVAMGLNMSWKVFDGGEILGRVRAARETAVQQDVLYERLKQSIPGQVSATYGAVEDLAVTVKKLSNSDLAEQNLRLSRSAFEAGRISQLEVLDAVDQNIDYHLQQLRVRYGLDLALIQLDRALGRTARLEEPKP